MVTKIYDQVYAVLRIRGIADGMRLGAPHIDFSADYVDGQKEKFYISAGDRPNLDPGTLKDWVDHIFSRVPFPVLGELYVKATTKGVHVSVVIYSNPGVFAMCRQLTSKVEDSSQVMLYQQTDEARKRGITEHRTQVLASEFWAKFGAVDTFLQKLRHPIVELVASPEDNGTVDIMIFTEQEASK